MVLVNPLRALYYYYWESGIISAAGLFSFVLSFRRHVNMFN